MTKKEFYQKLRGLDKNEWTVEGKTSTLPDMIRLIRRGKRYCPITAILREQGDLHVDATYMQMKKTLRLAVSKLKMGESTAKQIVYGADGGDITERTNILRALRHLPREEE